MKEIIKAGRRQGNTTRLADQCIQELFTKGKCVCKDHINTRRMDEYLMRIVHQRLRVEHRSIFDNIKIDRRKFTIYFENWGEWQESFIRNSYFKHE
jgi:hypothetical protein